MAMPDFVPVMGNSVCVAFNLVSVFESVHLGLVMVYFDMLLCCKCPRSETSHTVVGSTI